MKTDSQVLSTFLDQHPRLLVITGAGVSAESGISTYRDREGKWQASTPISHQQFIGSADYRQRYWARSFVGWPAVAAAQPNPAHYALNTLEKSGHIELLVTQNVDRLHQRAGSSRVVDLHGRLDQVVCIECGTTRSRADVQAQLGAENPHLRDVSGRLRPDGDAQLSADAIAGIRVPACAQCRGALMPDVVFFGGTIPPGRVAFCKQALERCDAVLAVGTSLQVYSGFRLCRQAHALGKPLVIFNQGATRADALATLKIDAPCAETLLALGEPSTLSARNIGNIR